MDVIYSTVTGPKRVEMVSYDAKHDRYHLRDRHGSFSVPARYVTIPEDTDRAAAFAAFCDDVEDVRGRED